MSVSALGRLKNHNVPHLHPNSTMFMPLDRLQLNLYAFSGKFNVRSKRVLLPTTIKSPDKMPIFGWHF